MDTETTKAETLHATINYLYAAIHATTAARRQEEEFWHDFDEDRYDNEVRGTTTSPEYHWYQIGMGAHDGPENDYGYFKIENVCRLPRWNETILGWSRNRLERFEKGLFEVWLGHCMGKFALRLDDSSNGLNAWLRLVSHQMSEGGGLL
ncbi:MAG: hypothetical protein Q9162_001325 [Coniocarpon cinnabarinum]